MIDPIRIPGYVIRLCETVEEKERCRDLAYRRMLTPEYGLQDIARARDEYDDVTTHVFLAVCAEHDGRLAGACRLRLDYDLSAFGNLRPETRDLARRGCRAADIGAYFECPARDQASVFAVFFTACTELLLRRNHEAMYIQSRAKHVPTYQSLGFELVGAEFSVPGWSTTWYPLLLRIREVLPHFHDLGFQESWKRRSGRQLKTGIWDRVAAHLEQRSVH